MCRVSIAKKAKLVMASFFTTTVFAVFREERYSLAFSHLFNAYLKEDIISYLKGTNFCLFLRIWPKTAKLNSRKICQMRKSTVE